MSNIDYGMTRPGLDPYSGGWTNGYDLPGGGDDPVFGMPPVNVTGSPDPGWTNGYDLPGGGDTPTNWSNDPFFPNPTGGGNIGGGGGNNTGGSTVFNGDPTSGMFDGLLSNPLLIPSLATAAQQWHQAGQYQDTAEGYAKNLDPFGAQRPQYQDLLSKSYSDPNSVLEGDPAYAKFKQSQMDNLQRQQASKGYLGSGNMEQALADYQGNSDNQYLKDYRSSLQVPAGANIGPEASAQMLMAGMNGKFGAQNAALAALMAPFGNQQQKNSNAQQGVTINNNNNGSSNSQGGNSSNGTSSGADIMGQLARRAAAVGFAGGTSADLMQWLLKNPNVSDSGGSLINSLKIPGLSGGDLNSGGGDYAPGFGGTPDPTDWNTGGGSLGTPGIPGMPYDPYAWLDDINGNGGGIDLGSFDFGSIPGFGG